MGLCVCSAGVVGVRWVSHCFVTGLCEGFTVLSTRALEASWNCFLCVYIYMYVSMCKDVSIYLSIYLSVSMCVYIHTHISVLLGDPRSTILHLEAWL